MCPFRLLLGILLCISGNLAAQSGAALNQYDAKIEAFFEKGARDSFLFYKEKKADLARQQDALDVWANQQLDIYDFLFENGEAAEASRRLNACWLEKWREPKNAAEWGTFSFIQSYRGMDFLEASKIVQAISAFESAAEINSRFPHPDLDLIESIYKPLGNCYTMLGDNDKALAVLSKILPLDATDEALAGTYCNIGLAYWNKGDYRNAEKYHKMGLDLADVSRQKKALLLGALSQTLLDKGQASAALKYAEQSLALLAAEKTRAQTLEYRCYARRSAGIAHLQLGRFKEALQLLTGARSDALLVFGPKSRELGKVDLAIGNLLLLQGNSAAAMVAANQALSSVLPGFEPLRPVKNPDPGTFYEETVIFEALSLKARAAQVAFESSGDYAWLEFALDCHELAWQAERKLRSIYQYSSSKLHLQSSARKRQTTAMQVLRLLFEKTGKQTYLEKAFEIAERSKAVLLGEALQDNLVRQNLVASDPRFSTLSALRQNFSLFEKRLLLDPTNTQSAEWRAEADRLTEQIKALEQEIATAYPQLAEAPLADFHTLIAGLPTGTCLLEYFVGQGFISCFIFQKNQAVRWHSIPNHVELQDLTSRFLAFFEGPNAMLNDPSAYLDAAFSLGQLLLPPETRSASTLVIIPDGFLNFIPFDALLHAKPDASTTLRNAEYVLRTQTIRYAWSYAVLQQQQQLRSGAKYHALYLAPGFKNGERGQAPLITEQRERPKQCKAFMDAAADLPHFMAEAGKHRILHLSTHAYASTRDSLLPRLELFDQALYLPSIYALPLQADLVVLSACQTGLGQWQSGEGVMSLARAFSQAGSAGVLSSLWAVNDQSTSRLLSDFYRQLEAGNSVSAALRAAKLAYLENDARGVTVQSPYFWAGLTMVGDDRVITANGPGTVVWLVVLLATLALAWLLIRRFRLFGQQQ